MQTERRVMLFTNRRNQAIRIFRGFELPGKAAIIRKDGDRLIFADRGQPDFREPPSLAHGRFERRAIWTSARINDYLDFPGVGQAFVIKRFTIKKTTGVTKTETVYGVPSHTPTSADPAALLAFNRGHWSVENGCHNILNWNWDEDRRTGHGPTNIKALRRFGIGAIKAKYRDTVAATIQRLARNVRLVFDYLRMTENSRGRPLPAAVG